MGVETVLSAGDMSADITSDTIKNFTEDSIAVQCVFTGSPVGTLEYQGSLNDSDWYNLEAEVVIDAAANVIFGLRDDYQNVPFTRVFFDKYAASTGSLTIYASKRVSGR